MHIYKYIEIFKQNFLLKKKKDITKNIVSNVLIFSLANVHSEQISKNLYDCKK